MGTFMPFSGTGMGFHRKSMYCIEMINEKLFFEKLGNTELINNEYKDPFGRIVRVNPEYFGNNEGETVSPEYYNNTKYVENPFGTFENKPSALSKSTGKTIFKYTAAFAATVILALSIIIYKGTTATELPFTFLNSAKVYENVFKPVDISKIEESKILPQKIEALKKVDKTSKNIVPKNKNSIMKDKSAIEMNKTVIISKIITSTNNLSDKNQNTKN
jgi:hypothetical protein